MGSLASRRSEINLSRHFRSSSPSTDQSVDPDFESNSMSFVLPPSPPNTDLLDALSPPLSLSPLPINRSIATMNSTSFVPPPTIADRLVSSSLSLSLPLSRTNADPLSMLPPSLAPSLRR